MQLGEEDSYSVQHIMGHERSYCSYHTRWHDLLVKFIFKYLMRFSYFIYSLYTSSGFSYFPITSLYYKMGQNCCSNTLHCTDAKEFNYHQPPFRKSTTKEYFSNYYSGFSTASVNNSSITEFDIRELNSNSLDSETTSFYSGINTQKNNSDIFTTEFILGFDDIDFDEIPNEKNQSKNLTHRY